MNAKGKPKPRAKTGGRKRGTPNKMTATNRMRLSSILDSINVEEDLQKLTAYERINLFVSLAKYVVAPMPTEEVKTDSAAETVAGVRQLLADAGLMQDAAPLTPISVMP